MQATLYKFMSSYICIVGKQTLDFATEIPPSKKICSLGIFQPFEQLV